MKRCEIMIQKAEQDLQFERVPTHMLLTCEQSFKKLLPYIPRREFMMGDSSKRPMTYASPTRWEFHG